MSCTLFGSCPWFLVSIKGFKGFGTYILALHLWISAIETASIQSDLMVPFTRKYPSGLLNKRITITGYIDPNPNRFIINLRADSDIAFHFNPRFNEEGEKVIVRNSEIGGTWGTEECDGSTFPFVEGKPFVMDIEVTPSCFKVKVDGSDLLEFNHRMDPGAINRIDINKDVTLSKIETASIQSDLTVPFTQKYPYGFLNKRITIIGTVKPDADRFIVNLRADSDIAFHFNPRFNEGEKVIVRNSYIGGTWGTEELDGSFPFVEGQLFVMDIEVTECRFKVKVDGSNLLEFNHRMDPGAINAIGIFEDVTLSKVTVGNA